MQARKPESVGVTVLISFYVHELDRALAGHRKHF